MSEVWAPIVGFESHYEVSSAGRVRSLPRSAPMRNGVIRAYPGRDLRPGRSGPYLSVCLGSRSYHVHRLVALAFLGAPPPGRPHVNHLDNDGTHNAVQNLEWCSVSENLIHALRSGRKGKVSTSEVVSIRERWARGASQSCLASEYGIDKTTVSLICRRITWRHVA